MTAPATPPAAPAKKGGCLRNAAIAGGGVLVLLCILAAIGSRLPATPSTTVKTATPQAIQAAAALPTEAPAAAEPTAAPAPTDAPAAEPTSAPVILPTEPAPTEAPAASAAKIGDRVEGGGVALMVTKVSTATKASILKPDAGNVFLLVEVVIETTDRDTAPYNPLYFKVKDADGYEYNAGINPGSGGLKSGELAKGEKVRGVVLFEVPKAATGFVLSYQPIVIAGGYEPLKVSLDE